MNPEDLKFHALRSYFKNGKIKNPMDLLFVSRMSELIENSIQFISSNTKYSPEELYKKLNENIKNIKLVNNFEKYEKASGVACVDKYNRVIMIRADALNRPEIQKIITHELTHAIGFTSKKAFPFKVKFTSGYLVQLIYTITKQVYESDGAFNEALVESFACKERVFDFRRFLNYRIYSNVDNPNFGINANLARQMFIAKGITEQEWIDGLFDVESAEKVIDSFDEETFGTISKNMDEIYKMCGVYGSTEAQILKLKKSNQGPLEDIVVTNEHARTELIINIEESERLIIDKILLPELENKTPEEKQKILRQYNQYIISERPYFTKKTGFVPDVEDMFKFSTPKMLANLMRVKMAIEKSAKKSSQNGETKKKSMLGEEQDDELTDR